MDGIQGAVMDWGAIVLFGGVAVFAVVWFVGLVLSPPLSPPNFPDPRAHARSETKMDGDDRRHGSD